VCNRNTGASAVIYAVIAGQLGNYGVIIAITPYLRQTNDRTTIVTVKRPTMCMVPLRQ
jgi:hypothetical protein